VLTLIDCMMTAGAEIFATRIALGLDPGRFESTIVSSRRSAPEHVDAARGRGVNVLELNRRSKLDVLRWAPLVRLIRSGAVDVVHAHKIGSNIWAAVLSHVADMPVLVTHEHTWSFTGNPLRTLVDRELIARAATMCLSVSESDREKMIALEGIDAEKVRFVPVGVPDVLPGDRTAARASLGVAEDELVVGTVCGLRPQKAVGVTVEAVAAVARNRPGVRLVVVGDGPERGALERRARELLGDRATFAGGKPNSEIPDLVAAMDVLVCSSDFEGTPAAVLEWMRAGKPIVATSVGGIPGIIENGVEGLLVPPRAPAALAAAIERLLADDELRGRLGSAARKRQQAEFRFSHTLEQLEDLYEELYWSSPHALRELRREAV
jgi:glycosyltransferase involved in cell wall biosynthesis